MERGGEGGVEGEREGEGEGRDDRGGGRMGREEGKGWKENGSGRHKDARKGQHVYASPWEEGGGRGGRWERREVVEEASTGVVE